MNSQNKNEGLGNTKVANVVEIIALITVYVAGLIFVWNFIVDNGIISIGTEKPALQLPTEQRFTDGGASYTSQISYEPPSGWKIVEYPGFKYKIAIGMPKDSFAPNFNIIEETFIGSLDDYANASLESVKRMFADFEFISQEKSETDGGETYIRVVAEDTQNEKRLRQTFYCFAHGDTKFVITYTRLANSGEENDVFVEQSIKTFRIEK